MLPNKAHIKDSQQEINRVQVLTVMIQVLLKLSGPSLTTMEMSSVQTEWMLIRMMMMILKILNRNSLMTTTLMLMRHTNINR